jgi:YfiH family protein
MHLWTWIEHQGNSYLQCDLLKDWRHGFFTQDWWPQAPSHLVEAIAPDSQAYRVKQVHGNTVLTIAEWQRHCDAAEASIDASQDRPIPEADGLIARQASEAVWAASADCVPALIADQQTGDVAAVHAGWRGTSKKIIPVAIQRLLDQGSRLENLRVALGPAIDGEVYQVSAAVAAEVGATVVNGVSQSSCSDAELQDSDCLQSRNDTAIAQILDALKALEQPPILDDPQPGRVRLDVRRINALQLEHLGLAPEQVAIAPYCTFQHDDRFFSYRRSREKKVQWSGIAAN